MSDDKKDGHDAGEAKKDDKKATAPAAKGGGIKALLGPIAAVLVLVGGGVGIGMFLSGFLSKAPAAAEHGAGEGEHGAKAEGEHAEGGAHAGLLHSSKEMVIEDVVANVKDQGGKRFAKITPSIYVTTAAVAPLGLEGGGHGGGEAGGEIKRILKARIEEHLKQYDLEELTSQAIYKRLEKNIREIAEKEIKAFAPDLPSDKPVVVKIVLNGLVVQ